MKPRRQGVGRLSGSLTLIVTPTLTGAVWPTGTVTPAAVADGVRTRMRFGVTETHLRRGAVEGHPHRRLEAAAVDRDLLAALRVADAGRRPRRRRRWPAGRSGRWRRRRSAGADGAHGGRARRRCPAKSTAWARPLTSCTRDRPAARRRLPKPPRLVVSVTSVRSGGGWPLSVRRTSTVTVLGVVAAGRELRRVGRHRHGERGDRDRAAWACAGAVPPPGSVGDRTCSPRARARGPEQTEARQRSSNGFIPSSRTASRPDLDGERGRIAERCRRPTASGRRSAW